MAKAKPADELEAPVADEPAADPVVEAVPNTPEQDRYNDVVTRIDAALAPLANFPIGPVNGQQIRAVGAAVRAAFLALLEPYNPEPDPFVEPALPDGGL